MTIFWNNLRRIFGKPVNLVLMVVVPVVLNIFFISVNSMGVSYTIGVIDCDQSELTETLIAELEDRAEIVYLKDNEALIRSGLLNSEIDLALKFPENYAQSLMNGEAAKAQTFAIQETNVSEPITMLISSFTAAAQEFGKQSNGNAEKFYAAINDYVNGSFAAVYESFEFTPEENVSRAVTSLGYLAMGMMFLMSFATTLLLEDKLTRVYSRLMTTPLTRASYLLQHLLSYLIVAIIQIVVIINLIPAIVDISFGSTVSMQLQVMLVTLLFAVVCIAIGLTISRFSKNSVVSGALVGLVNFPLLMLGGCMWPRELMSETLQRIGDFLPTTWFLVAAEEVLYGNGLGAAGKYLLYLGALAAVLLIVSFTVKTDDKC